jgi:HEAT repeat protein
MTRRPHDHGGHDHDAHEHDAHEHDAHETDDHDLDGRDLDGRDLDGRDLDGRDLDGRDLDGRDLDAQARVPDDDPFTDDGFTDDDEEAIAEVLGTPNFHIESEDEPPGDDDAPEERPAIGETLAMLLENAEHEVVPARVYYGLSDLDDSELAQLHAVWASLPNAYRAQVMHRLAEIAQDNYEFDYTMLAAYVVTQDADGEARIAAIDILGISEDPKAISLLLDGTRDLSPAIRAAAVGALGPFVLLAEYGDLEEGEDARVIDAVLRALQNRDEPAEVRRRALESIANSSLALVVDAIDEAYASSDRGMQMSAVFAMGRSADERWASVVLNELESDDAEMRFQAVRAAGEIGLERAVPALKRAALGDDAEMRDMAVWSLGEIGGKRALDVLNLLQRDAERAGDEDLLALIEDAIVVASMGDGGFPLMDMGRR